MDAYDRNGNPITVEKLGLLFGNKGYCRVDFTEVGESRVSTVWLGMDHGYDEEGLPVIFETMVFNGQHDNYCERYTAETEAKAGHKRIVEALKKGESP
jgi:hypothetical protein